MVLVLVCSSGAGLGLELGLGRKHEVWPGREIKVDLHQPRSGQHYEIIRVFDRGGTSTRPDPGQRYSQSSLGLSMYKVIRQKPSLLLYRQSLCVHTFLVYLRL